MIDGKRRNLFSDNLKKITFNTGTQKITLEGKELMCLGSKQNEKVKKMFKYLR